MSARVSFADATVVLRAGLKPAPTKMWLCAWLLFVACDGSEGTVGYDEPLRVHGGTFESGELPGSPPSEGPTAEERDPPAITQLISPSSTALPGQSGKRLSGFVADAAFSIGVRLQGEGSGYWVVPVGAPDVNFPDQLSFALLFDLAPELEPGMHALQLVAFDGGGVAGTQARIDLCVVRPYDGSRNACDAKVLPPAAVISLSWDTDADLDLVVRTPSGKLVDADHPATIEVSDKAPPDLDAPGVGLLEGDSNAGCALDSARRENLVWRDAPEPGEYQVYVNVFDACHQRAAQFAVDSYVRTRGRASDEYDIEPLRAPLHGVVLDASANGGAKNGLLVGTIEFPAR